MFYCEKERNYKICRKNDLNFVLRPSKTPVVNNDKKQRILFPHSGSDGVKLINTFLP